jgi:hypothetical protein
MAGVLGLQDAAHAQAVSLDSLLSAHTYSISYDRGVLAGDGLKALSGMIEGSQFVALGEEHNTRAIPRFTTALFRVLRENHGFQYLALEEGPYIGRLLSAAARTGGHDSVMALARRHANAFHMYTEEELEMAAEVGRSSAESVEPIWGVNQEFGASHVLERLTLLAPNDSARARAQQLLARAQQYEAERFQENVHYLAAVARADDFAELRDSFIPSAGSEADVLLTQLELSRRIYAPFAMRPAPPIQAFHRSGQERERHMKQLLSERLREAQRRTAKVPRVLVKSGHLHLYRGHSERTELLTLGNFLAELAIFNGFRSTHLYATVDRPYVRDGWLAPFVRAAPAGMDALIDLRDLQPLAARNRIADLSPQVRRLILAYDAVLVFRDSAQGSLDRLRTARFRWYPGS